MSGYSVLQADVPTASIISLSTLPTFNASRLQDMAIDPDLLDNAVVGNVLEWDGDLWVAATGGGGTNVDSLAVGYPGVVPPSGDLYVRGDVLFGTSTPIANVGFGVVRTDPISMEILGTKTTVEGPGNARTLYDLTVVQPAASCNFLCGFDASTSFFLGPGIAANIAASITSEPRTQAGGTLNLLIGFYAKAPLGDGTNVGLAYGAFFARPGESFGFTARNALYAENAVVGVYTVNAPDGGLVVSGSTLIGTADQPAAGDVKFLVNGTQPITMEVIGVKTEVDASLNSRSIYDLTYVTPAASCNFMTGIDASTSFLLGAGINANIAAGITSEPRTQAGGTLNLLIGMYAKAPLGDGTNVALAYGGFFVRPGPTFGSTARNGMYAETAVIGAYTVQAPDNGLLVAGDTVLQTVAGSTVLGSDAIGTVVAVPNGIESNVLVSNGPGVLPSFQALPASGNGPIVYGTLRARNVAYDTTGTGVVIILASTSTPGPLNNVVQFSYGLNTTLRVSAAGTYIASLYVKFSPTSVGEQTVTASMFTGDPADPTLINNGSMSITGIDVSSPDDSCLFNFSAIVSLSATAPESDIMWRLSCPGITIGTITYSSLSLTKVIT